MDWFHIGRRNVKKDVRKRQRIQQAEPIQQMGKALMRHKKTTPNTKWRVTLSGQRPQLGRVTLVQNTCVFSTQTRSVYRRYRLARSTLKALANKGWLAGLRKASF